jgi:hypothetical protein
MNFSVSRSDDPKDATAPFSILLDNRPFLSGIQQESEAIDICRLCADIPAKRHAYPQAIRDLDTITGKLLVDRFRAAGFKGVPAEELAPAEHIEVDVNGKVFVNPWRKAGLLGAAKRWRKESGVVLLEAALIFPVLMLLIFAGFDLQRVIGAKNDLDYIAQRIAICTQAGTCPGGAQVIAQNIAQGFSMNPANITASAAGNSVTVSYAWQPFSPFFQPETLTSVATAP